MIHRPTIAALLFVALTSPGCATVPGPGDPGYPYNVEGAYDGRLVFDGQPFDARVRLRTRPGGRVDGALRVVPPVAIEGKVTGAVRDDLLRISVTYRSSGDCDGRIEGILTVERGGGVIEGPVTVTDCADPVAGRMSFRRRTLDSRAGTGQRGTAAPPSRAER